MSYAFSRYGMHGTMYISWICQKCGTCGRADENSGAAYAESAAHACTPVTAGSPGPFRDGAGPAEQNLETEMALQRWEPLGLGERELPGYDETPPGCCSQCHLGAVYRARLCPYCLLLRDMKAQAVPARQRSLARNRVLVARVALLGTAIMLLVLAAHISALLVLPALACAITVIILSLQ